VLDSRWPEHAPVIRSTRLRRLVTGLLLLIGLLLVTRAFVAEPLKVSSDSMQPTLRSGDQVLVTKVGSRAHAPHRNDIVALISPADGHLLVKRVAAVGGDTVGLEDGVLVVNGNPVHEGYVDLRLMDGVYFGPIRVPRGMVFVLGDNRSNSVDSRKFGPVPESRIKGRVLLRLWPYR
jgi:signal peptidase I